MADALDLWERIEVGLDILREYNGTYEAVLAQGFGENLGQLCTLAANIIEARLEESLKEMAVEAEKALEEFYAAWVDAGQSIAKLPVDMSAICWWRRRSLREFHWWRPPWGQGGRCLRLVPES